MTQFLWGHGPWRFAFQLRLFLIAALTFPIFVPPSFAQGVPDLSIIDRRVKQEEKAPGGQKTPRAPRVEGAAPAAAAAVEPFILSGVIIEGATALTPADLTSAYEAFLLKWDGYPEVDAILNAITARYHAEGYFLSRAIAPAQEIVNGVLRVRVVEGYVAKFSAVGDYANAALLDKYARPTLAEHPATLRTIERALLLMSDLPGVTLEPRLKPIDAEAGEYELIAEIEYKPIDAYARLDNRGTPDVGRLQGWVGAGLNGVLGYGESLYATFITVPDEPKELLLGSLNASVPLGQSGTYASLYGAYGAIDAGGSSAQFDTDSTSEQAIFQLGHPIIRSRAQSLWINGIFDFRNFEQTQFDQTIVDDKTRVFCANLSYSLKDEWKGESQVGLGISQGVDFLGASSEGSVTNSRSDGRSQFTKLTGNAVRLQGITDRISLRASVAGQWSADPLLSYEEFSLGGEGYGRGYDYGELTGEHGAAFSGEVRYGSALNWQWLSEYQLYGFYDIGAVWNETSNDKLSLDHLSSAGAGFRLRMNDYLKTGFEAAKPLDKAVSTTGDHDWRFFFSAVANY